jgi:hypothetical protein
MTNEEHWTQAKEQVAKNHGHHSAELMIGFWRGNLPQEYAKEAAFIMADAIRKEKDEEIKHESDLAESLHQIAIEKDKEIAELREAIQKYVHHLELFFSSPKVGQPPGLEGLKEVLTSKSKSHE